MLTFVPGGRLVRGPSLGLPGDGSAHSWESRRARGGDRGRGGGRGENEGGKDQRLSEVVYSQHVGRGGVNSHIDVISVQDM